MYDEDNEPVTTPGDMQWVPCDHSHTVKSRTGVCEACRGLGRVLILVNRAGRYSFVADTSVL